MDAHTQWDGKDPCKEEHTVLESNKLKGEKTEGVRTVVQWLPSHEGVIGNEIADGHANEGRTQPQPRKPSTLSDVWSFLRRPRARHTLFLTDRSNMDCHYRLSSLRRVGSACFVRMRRIGQCPSLGMGCLVPDRYPLAAVQSCLECDSKYIEVFLRQAML
ncbi:hypothetical protein PoB_007514900 [Plakobranchus ocellatus]|uniref:RNase H type-1 domain-containing protein n=1 Tax=Plakobranchus ocellatus TaxID=259542 RepID=A0AAV4DX52_9GAST|nr:hypothetical protein PoB_007514900 [Plakobranchus ocellatus]